MATLDVFHGSASTRGRFLHTLTTPFLALVEAWKLAHRRDAMRRELEGLSDRELYDIGLTRGEIEGVVERSYRR